MANQRGMAARDMLQSSGGGVADVNQQGMSDEFKGMLGILAQIVKQALAGDQVSQQIVIELGKALPAIAQQVKGGQGGTPPAPEQGMGGPTQGQVPISQEGGLA